MYFAGLDAHLRCVTVAVLDRLGALVRETTVPTREPERSLAMLAPFRPLEVVVETCPFWPWLYDLLVPAGIGFHLPHAKRLRAIATAPQKNDRVDARLLARMLLSGLIPEAYPRPGDQRELLRLLRHRTTLVRYRTRLAGRIHSQLHQQRLMLPREQLLRQATRGWLRPLALAPKAFQIPRSAVRPGPPLAEKGPASVCRRSSTPPDSETLIPPRLGPLTRC